MCQRVSWAVRFHLKFVDCTVRFWELPSVTILNQTEVKLNELLVVLLGNPLIDAVKSKNIVKNPQVRALKTEKQRIKPLRGTSFSPLCITGPEPERGEAVNITAQLFKVLTVCVSNTDACR